MCRITSGFFTRMDFGLKIKLFSYVNPYVREDSGMYLLLNVCFNPAWICLDLSTCFGNLNYNHPILQSFQKEMSQILIISEKVIVSPYNSLSHLCVRQHLCTLQHLKGQQQLKIACLEIKLDIRYFAKAENRIMVADKE